MTKAEQYAALHTWVGLNDALREADEALCQKLLNLELNGKARKQFISRIHSRLNKARADRERKELNINEKA